MRLLLPLRRVWLAVTALLTCLLLIVSAPLGHCIEHWVRDPGYPTPVFGARTNGGVSRVEVNLRQPDGKFLMQGDFTAINGTKTITEAASSFVRINADGTLDPTFRPQEITVNGTKRTWVPRLVQPSGKIIVDDGVSPFARLNADGSVDSTFQALGRPSLLYTTGPIYALTTPGQIQRFTADGAPDPTFPILNIPTLTLHGVTPDGRVVGSVTEGNGRRFIWFSKDGAELQRATSLHGAAIFGTDTFSYGVRVLADGSVLCFGNSTLGIELKTTRFFRFSSQGIVTQVADVYADTFIIADVIHDQLMQAGGGDIEVTVESDTDRSSLLLHNHEMHLRPVALNGILREYFPLARLILQDPTKPVAAYEPSIYYFGFEDAIPAGSEAVVSGVVFGAYPRTYQIFRDGVALTSASASTLPVPGYRIRNFQAADEGSYTLVVTNPVGTVTSDPVKLRVFAQPSITAMPPSVVVSPGQPIVLTVTTTGSVESYSHVRSLIPAWPSSSSQGTTGGSYSALLTDDPNPAGEYRFQIYSRQVGTITSEPVRVTVSPTAKPSRLSNISVRTFVGIGDKHLFLGFVAGGVPGANLRMPLLLRGIGPALTGFGVAGAMSDPVIALHLGDPIINSNNNWAGNTQVSNISAAIGAFALTDPASLDAALYLPALFTGTYTAEVFGSSTRVTGIALAEIYDATINPDSSQPRLINLSCRAQLDAAQSLITGFVIAGETAKTLLVRAIGPGLKDFGVTGTLSAGQLTILDSTGRKVAEHISGDFNPIPGVLAPRVGAFTARAKEDNALAVTLPPGAYTAQVRGVGNAAGVVLIEIYEVP